MDWMDAAAGLVESLGTEEFPAILARGLRRITPCDFIVIFGYSGSARPLKLYDDFPPDRRRLHVEEYQEGPYLLDPFYLASLDLEKPGLWRLKDIAPDRFYQGEYFRNYYAQTGLAEEIGYLVRVRGDLVLVVSLMRRDRRFSRAKFRGLEGLWPFVDAVCRKNWQNLAVGGDRRAPAVDNRIQRAFRTIGDGILTPREQEVVELTLRGHSAEATGQRLGITSGTVRIHRRNIYTKLRIGSQGELFSIFIRALASN